MQYFIIKHLFEGYTDMYLTCTLIKVHKVHSSNVLEIVSTFLHYLLQFVYCHYEGTEAIECLIKSILK